MKQLIARSAIGAGAVLIVFMVAACNGSDKNGSGGSVGMTPPAPAADSSAQFGAKFSAALNAPQESDPQDIADGDVIEANLSADPIDLP